MHSFISHLVQEVLSSGVPLKDINIVIPGRRAGLFLKKELAKNLNEPSWVPRIYTIEDLAVEMSRLEMIDSTALLFEFYSVYGAMVEKKDSFDVFARWGQTLLSDFNEIDRYMLKTEDIFSTLQAVEKIEDWDMEMPLSAMMQDHKTFWHLGEKLYYALREHLLSIGKGYQGMIFRRAGENAGKGKGLKEDDSMWIFAGFNAMNTSEISIVKYFLENKNARIYYHADKYYMEGKHSSGVFLRRFKDDGVLGKNFSWVWDDMSSRKKMTLMGVPKQVGQAKTASSVLKEMLATDAKLEDTVVVLSDEKLLVPMLSSMPESIKAVNVTMGYPVSALPASGWGDAVMALHATPERLGLKGFYYKDVITMLQQPVTSSYLTSGGKNYALDVCSDVVKRNMVDFSLEKLFAKTVTKDGKDITVHYPDEINERLRFLFKRRKNTPIEVCEHIICLIDTMRIGKYAIDELSMEYLYKIHGIFTTLSSYMKKYPYVENMTTFSGFYHQLSQGETIDFYGEPLEGLQLMGILETRLLNFKNIIITGVNEGTLPQGRADNSFMPHDVKNHYGLPTYSEKDAIYSYHFFRLLQGAQNVTIIYNTDEGATGQVEPSRFILQLKHDFSKIWDICEKTVSSTTGALPPRVTEVEKTPYALKKTKEILKKGLSPSTLCAYMTNPMDFYYKKILEISEAEEVDETAAANTMGTIIHEILQAMYTFKVGKYLTEGDIDFMLSQVEKEMKNAFDKNMAGQNYRTGANYLVYEAVRRIIFNFLQSEKKCLKDGNSICIKGLEEKMEHTLLVDDVPVRLYGVADRVDVYNGVWRVVDYKTGRVETSDLSLEDVNSMSVSYTDTVGEEKVFKNSKALQVLMYAYMYGKKEKDLTDFTAGIMSLRNPRQGFLNVCVAGNNLLDNDVLYDVEKKITETVRLMLDSNVPYTEHGAIYYDIVS